MDAITQGTSDGLRLAINVVGMLLVLVALVALVNLILSALPPIAGADLSVQRILGWMFAPLAWLIGIPWSEAMTAGSLLGSKMVLNELIAYLEMAALDAEQLSQHSRLIMTYALCGFANLGSLGIMIGGLIAMCPERRDDILELAPRTLVSGTLATLMTGAVIGLVS
jgi:CNT family concentrative nucleoside transporter